MNIRPLLAGLALAFSIAGFAGAQEMAPTPKSELKAIVEQTKAKIKAGQKSAQDLAPEIAAMDGLLAKYKDQKTDEVAQIAYTKATLYSQVLNDSEAAKKMLAQLVEDFPGTRTASLVAVPKASGGSGAASRDSSKLASGQAWMTDWAAAKALAAKDNKKLLMNFTGSDWCGFCIKLDDEVFATEEFSKFAKDYVLVKVDFPHSKELPEQEKEQNNTLKQEFGARGFPTVLIADASGKELSRAVGYQPGSGPDAYVSKLTSGGN